MNIRTAALTLVAAASLTLGAAAQTTPDQATPGSMTRATTDAATTHNWTTDQIITATVHQAWLLSDKNEANFFEIIKELAEISAKNRDLTLPDSPEAGQKAGAYIKKQARADHDQLLYAIVDKSVRMTGTKAPATK
ncbi:hypothetical protein [Granulicella arctica]|uniref:hypothetical protein n=1 Tax=Granulicella arctica TaxID=940613 RepID=UPI0021E08A6E|nr:hypothetical protein [Granulicella arctica]